MARSGRRTVAIIRAASQGNANFFVILHPLIISKMNCKTETVTLNDKIISFLWQHLFLVISLFIMTSGVALCVRSCLGSSVISTIPFVMSLAGEASEAPAMTIGEYTYLMNVVLVFLQIILLRRRFRPVQLFQLVIGLLFGFLLDINMALTAWIDADTIVRQIVVQLAGCVILGIGISFELRCGSVTMPGEGITVAVNKAFGLPFPKAKIMIDCTLVAIAVVISYLYFGRWLWAVVGPGTLIAMIFVGWIVKIVDPHMEWFTHLLYYRPGFRRYIYGLARYIYRRFS